MSCDQAFDKLSEKLNIRLLVQEDHGFQEGAQCAPLATGAPKKPGIDRVKLMFTMGHVWLISMDVYFHYVPVQALAVQAVKVLCLRQVSRLPERTLPFLLYPYWQKN